MKSDKNYVTFLVNFNCISLFLFLYFPIAINSKLKYEIVGTRRYQKVRKVPKGTHAYSVGAYS